MENLAIYFKALGEVTRLKIINKLSEGELCVCQIIEQLQLSQPAVSHHMKILKQAGLVNDRKQGKWNHYYLNKKAFEELKNELQDKIFLPASQDITKKEAFPVDKC